MQGFSLDIFLTLSTVPCKKNAVTAEKSPILIDKPPDIVYNNRKINYFERHSAKNGTPDFRL
jgi:hypothetical protein